MRAIAFVGADRPGCRYMAPKAVSPAGYAGRGPAQAGQYN